MEIHPESALNGELMFNNNAFNSNTFGLLNQSMAGFFSESKSAVIDNKYRQELVSKSRVLLQKVPLARAAIDVLVRGVVGSGLHVKESSDVLEVLSSLHLFDATKQLDFYQLQQQIWQTTLVCGECFLIRNPPTDERPYSSWFVSEPDNIFTPPIITCDANGQYFHKGHLVIDGIEFKSDGTPWALHYCKNPYTADLNNKNNWQRIFFEDKQGVPNIIHVKIVDRPEYPRGLPILAPLTEILYSLYAYQSAQVQMGIVQSAQCFVVKTEDVNKSLNPFQGLSSADLNAPLVCNSLSDTQHEHEPSQDFSIMPPNNADIFGMTTTANYIRPGMSYHLGTNESIEHLSTDAPGNTLREFYDLVVDQVGAALGIPPAVLKNVFDVSFSSSKCSVSQWQYTVSRYTNMFVEQALKPLYRVFLMEVGESAKDAIVESTKSVWQKQDPTFLLDENRSATFVEKCLALGLITKEEAAMRLLGHPLDADAVPIISDL